MKLEWFVECHIHQTLHSKVMSTQSPDTARRIISAEHGCKTGSPLFASGAPTMDHSIVIDVVDVLTGDRVWAVEA